MLDHTLKTNNWCFPQSFVFKSRKCGQNVLSIGVLSLLIYMFFNYIYFTCYCNSFITSLIRFHTDSAMIKNFPIFANKSWLSCDDAAAISQATVSDTLPILIPKAAKLKVMNYIKLNCIFQCWNFCLTSKIFKWWAEDRQEMLLKQFYCKLIDIYQLWPWPKSVSLKIKFRDMLFRKMCSPCQ